MKDPIHLCDVVIYDAKARREYKLDDVVLAGNNKDLIWGCDHHRDRLIKYVFKTPAKVKKQKQNLSLTLRSIEFKVPLGYSNYNWGLST